MKIPTGVNYIEFYRAAKSKGVKVKSNYIGVHVSTRNGNNIDIAWRTAIKVKGIYSSWTFPFTEEGERDAFTKYKSVRGLI